MSHQLFIVPIGEVAHQHGAWIRALKEFEVSWETYVSSALDASLWHVNQGGIDDLLPENLTDGGVDEFTDSILTNYMDADADAYHRYYGIASAATTALLRMAYQYLHRILDQDSTHGMPSTIAIERMVGMDIVLTVQYLDRFTPLTHRKE